MVTGAPQMTSMKARQTARAVPRRTTVAITQYREWSSRPEMSFTAAELLEEVRAHYQANKPEDQQGGSS